MTKVTLSKTGAKEFEKVIDVFTEEDKISLRYWISFVEKNGIKLAQENISFRDHELFEKWAGYRAASFGFSARVIYRIVNLKIEIVEIERITTTHDYKR